MQRFRVGGLACVRHGTGRPLVLLHPIVFSKAYVDLAAFPFDGVAVDLPGHGETEAPVDLDRMGADVASVLDAVGWTSASVGGTSLGAAAAIRFALGYPDRVDALVLDLPGFGPRSFRDPEKTGRMAAAFEKSDFVLAERVICEGMAAPRAKAWGDALRADWAHYERSALGPKLAAVLRASAGWSVAEPWPSALSAIRARTTVLGVKGDPVHPWETAAEIAGAIPGARLLPRVASLDPARIARQWTEVLA
jgi:pimeloyl-ACP methyl ester carboxylesterase